MATVAVLAVRGAGDLFWPPISLPVIIVTLVVVWVDANRNGYLVFAGNLGITRRAFWMLSAGAAFIAELSATVLAYQ